MSNNFCNKELVIVRGGGDIASGTIMKLHQCGFQVLILENERPSAIRRNVAFSEAVYQGTQTIEGVTCYLAKNLEEAKSFLAQGRLTMLVDSKGACLDQLKPIALVDAILAKKNLGTCRSMAPITIGLGPGFQAGPDQEVDAVIETMRGHNLGRVIYQGSALPNTGVPGMIAGCTRERVIYSPAKGYVENVCRIADRVKKGDIIAYIQPFESNQAQETGSARPDHVQLKSARADCVPVYASLDGILRGLIRDGYPVTEGLKMADIDPRIEEYDNCFTISDKARCIAGGVLEAILHLRKKC